MKSAFNLGLYVFFTAVLIYPFYKTVHSYHDRVSPFVLLIPKEETQSLATKVWLQAAREEGAPLEIMTDEEFLAPFKGPHAIPEVVLVPDEVARVAPTTLIASLQNFVKEGGKLVLVGDAFSQNSDGRLVESFPIETYFQFPEIQGRVGDTLQFTHGAVELNEEWKVKLQIPPGQYAPSELTELNANFRELSTYQKEANPYPYWRTFPASQFSGKVLLRSTEGSLVAGMRSLGNGQVLWINLPLSYLKRRTDGLLLHSFLRYVSQDFGGFPRLLSVPNGVGGVVLNIHVDSNASLPGLKIMKKLKIFEQGPFSIHVTAGPDTRAPGDGLGFDVPNNPVSQEWIRTWVKEGHEVGAHGGWIHDYFGYKVNDTESPEFETDLELNRSWIEKITGKPVREYSAPLGNHPVWVTRWLRAHGFNSYYFTGNSGMGPTQNFRDLEFTDQNMWSFPISAFQQVASFEEAKEKGVSEGEMGGWLKSLSHFVSDQHVVRLFYFHPPGVTKYEGALKNWMELNQELLKQTKFQWYTMNALSVFLTNRGQVQWKIGVNDDTGRRTLEASAHSDLHSLVWSLPRARVKGLKVESGQVKIREERNEILLQPDTDSSFRVSYEEVLSD